MKNHNTILIPILFTFFILFTIIIVLNNSNRIRKKEVVIDDGFFKIQDSAIVNKSDILIENLVLKNGFKNLFLGANFKEYNFALRNWRIEESYNKKVIECTARDVSKIYINGVQLEKINLVFFNNFLISIKIYSKLSKKKVKMKRAFILHL